MSDFNSDHYDILCSAYNCNQKFGLLTPEEIMMSVDMVKSLHHSYQNLQFVTVDFLEPTKKILIKYANESGGTPRHTRVVSMDLESNQTFIDVIVLQSTNSIINKKSIDEELKDTINDDIISSKILTTI